MVRIACFLLFVTASADAMIARAGLRRPPTSLRLAAPVARPVTASPRMMPADGDVDVAALLKYPTATVVQVGLIAGALAALDKAGFGSLPTPCAIPLFAFLALRTRVFSFLDSSRPDRKAQGGAATPRETKRPSWTPPGIAFPIIWSTITLLRVAASTMIFEANGHVLCSRPILALMVHLACGDTWNSITNVERRLGVSFSAVFAVLGSVCWAVFEYSKVDLRAAYVLLPNAVWISIATVLTGAIWQLNTPLQPLLPRTGEVKKPA